jgi:pyridoxine 4-dehydrogenase
MTWRWPAPVPDEEAFAAIKAGVDALPLGTKLFLNSGRFFSIPASLVLICVPSAEFYGQGLSTGNLELLARFFDKYPDYADRTFLSVKGGTVPGQLASNGSRENLRRSVDVILKALRGTKRLDLFEPARRDSNYEIEQYAESLNEMVKEGKFDHIGLSEVSAETIRRAHKVDPLFFFYRNRNTDANGYRSCRLRRSRSKSACNFTSNKPKTVSTHSSLRVAERKLMHLIQ